MVFYKAIPDPQWVSFIAGSLRIVACCLLIGSSCWLSWLKEWENKILSSNRGDQICEQIILHIVVPATVGEDMIELLLGEDGQPGNTTRALAAIGSQKQSFFYLCLVLWENQTNVNFLVSCIQLVMIFFKNLIGTYIWEDILKNISRIVAMLLCIPKGNGTLLYRIIEF